MLLSLFLTIPAQSTVTDVNRFNNFLLLAYVVFWLVALVYMLIMANRQRNAQQELELMRRLLEEDKLEDAL